MKNFLIVGGTSGIGLALTKKLQAEGHHVTVVARKNSDEIQGMEHVDFVEMDVLAEELTTDQLPEELDGLAYCPGSINLKPFRSLKVKDFQRDFDINVLGAVRILQATRKALKKGDPSSVVLFSTVAAGQGLVFHASVSAAKSALEGMARTLAAEWAPHIRVNCIAPSLTDTPMASHLLSSEDRREASDKRHPLRRVGQPDDIAGMAAYLLSEQASWISGQTIGVDGGMSTLRV